MIDPGSFRDPDSRVFEVDGEIRRSLSADGLADFRALQACGLLDGDRIIATELLPATATGGDAMLPTDVAGILGHARVPFVSYAYEWTFSMLKDAALLQLDLMLAALEHDLTLKDASPYNVQFVGAAPVFIDVGSFERLREEELWVGYRQFCMLYLFPLLLQATKGFAFQPLLRGSINGISPQQMRAVMALRDHFRRGYLTHVRLQARLEQREPGDATRMSARLRRPGLGKQVIAANVRKMRRWVARLDWSPPRSVWVGYNGNNSYTDADARRKDEFVRAVTSARPWSLVWDLGANAGRHSRIAAETAATVVAMDADPGTVELLYRRLRTEGNRTVLPLTVDLADLSPGIGWRNRERRPLTARGRPDLVLALAVVHHLAITANVPLAEIVHWFADLGAVLVVEFPTRDDPMVQRLLRNKRPGLHSDYRREVFEWTLKETFDVLRVTPLEDSPTRVLYHAVPKAGAARC